MQSIPFVNRYNLKAFAVFCDIKQNHAYSSTKPPSSVNTWNEGYLIPVPTYPPPCHLHTHMYAHKCDNRGSDWNFVKKSM